MVGQDLIANDATHLVLLKVFYDIIERCDGVCVYGVKPIYSMFRNRWTVHMQKAILTIILSLSFRILLAGIETDYYNTFHINADQGLPHSLVFDICQTQDGFIWVATNNGLGRYDGYQFKTFRPILHSDNCPQGKSINRLFDDVDGNLWLSIQGIGLNRLDLSTETFYHYDDEVLSSNIGNNVMCFQQSNTSELWLGTNLGLHKYIREADTFERILPDEIVTEIVHIDEDVNGCLWLSSYEDVFVYNPDTRQLNALETLDGLSFIADYSIAQMRIYKQRYLVISTHQNGIVIYDIVSRKSRHLFEGHNHGGFFIDPGGNLFFIVTKDKAKLGVVGAIDQFNSPIQILTGFDAEEVPLGISFRADSKKNVWLSYGNRLLKITKDLNISQLSSLNEKGLLNRDMFVTLIDDMDNLWIRSERNGIVRIDLNQNKFTSYQHLADINPIISGENISMVFEDSQGRLWVGCHSKGVSCFDPKTNKYTDYLYQPDRQNAIQYRAPAGISEDKYGHIWIGFYDGTLQKLNPATGQLVTYNATIEETNPNYLDVYGIRSIIKSRDDHLWLATNSKGLVEFDIDKNEFIYHSLKYEEDYLNNSHYRFVTQTKDGLIWTGTQNGGLGRYDITQNTFVHYKTNGSDAHSISGNTVYFICEENDSSLWVGTDKGLNRFNRLTKTFQSIPIYSEGNLCAIYRIYTHGDHLWLSSDCGIVKINKSSLDYVLYKKSDGLPGNEFNTTSGCQGVNGHIYLGTSKGLVSFHPDKIVNNPHHARPVLTDLKLFNRVVKPGEKVQKQMVLPKAISEIQTLELPYYLNDFTFEFSSLHYASPGKNSYRYRMEGHNTKWISTGANRRWANYTGLEPGSYEFTLMATNNDSQMCSHDHVVRLNVIIVPPYYETWWFRLFIVACCIGLIALMLRWRIHKVKRQKRRLEDEVQQRTRELTLKNTELEESREEVSVQNKELEAHRNQLEHLVEERTVFLEKALKKAEESDRLKTAFLSNMSHEIRTPMNAILGFAEIMKQSGTNADDISHYTDIIHDNAESLLDILNDIIDISMIETNQLVIRKQKLNVKHLLNDTLRMYAKDGKGIKNPDLAINVQGDDLEIYSDPGRLKQILSNLINNAIKFTPAGNVNITYYQKQQYMFFEVKDTGIGIRADRLEHIFDRFYKVDNPLEEVYRGNGLGLAISKSLVEALGGSIEVQSEAGKGTSVYFSIELE